MCSVLLSLNSVFMPYHAFQHTEYVHMYLSGCTRTMYRHVLIITFHGITLRYLYICSLHHAVARHILLYIVCKITVEQIIKKFQVLKEVKK